MSGRGSLVFGAILSKHITAAIDSVVQAAGVIASGDLAHRIPVRRTKDELNLLASSFNEMAEQLEGKIRELTESEKKYSTVVENANDGIVIFKDQMFVFANEAFCKIIGYSLDELIGMNYLSIASTGSADLLRDRHLKRLQGEEVPGITEGEFISKNGDIRYLEVNAGLIDYSNQQAVLVVFRDITERKEYETSLKRLSEKVFTAQEKERKRISQELHDEVGQALSVMNISTELLQRNNNLSLTDQQKRLEDLKKLIEKTLDDIHRISYNLRPYLLDNFGLVSALRWYTKDYSERTGIEIGLQIEGDWGELPRALETVIYRVIQEALTNVSKHAEASRVFISVSYYPASIEIEIEDNGKGFEVDKDLRKGMLLKGGLGLFGIKERVAAFGGVFSITSKKGSGTMISIQIPTQYVTIEDN
jgi:PAS domain S-box-containing protein